MLAELQAAMPQYEMAGVRNVWVIKPAAKSRGRGIFCENRLDLILPVVTEGSVKDRWVRCLRWAALRVVVSCVWSCEKRKERH